MLSLLLALPAVVRASGGTPVLVDQAQNCAQDSNLCFGGKGSASDPPSVGARSAAADPSSSAATAKTAAKAHAADAEPPKPGFLSTHVKSAEGFMKKHEVVLSGLAGAVIGYAAVASLALGPAAAGALLGFVVGAVLIPKLIHMLHHEKKTSW
jgi:hypothetical protein